MSRNSYRSKLILAAALSSTPAPTLHHTEHVSLTNNDNTFHYIHDDHILQSEPQPSCSYIEPNTQGTEPELENIDLDCLDDDSVADPDYIPSDSDDHFDSAIYNFCEDILSNQAIDFNDLDNDTEEPNLINHNEEIVSTEIVNEQIEKAVSHGNEQILFVAQYRGPIYIVNNATCLSQLLSSNKNMLKHPIDLRSCEGKCRRNCMKFTDEKRQEIWEKYWNMTYQSRRSFLNKCIQFTEVKRRRIKNDTSSAAPEYNKKESRFYSLPYESHSDLIDVCKRFFLNTLGYKTDGVVTELSKALKKGQLYASLSGENRGGKRKEIDRSTLHEHILSYHPAVSHYRRHNAPITRYLPAELTVRQLYKDFKEKYPQINCSEETYRTELKKMKISFNMPRGDKCDECVFYTEEKKKYNDETVIPAEITQKYEQHKTKSDQALKKYKNDATHKNTLYDKYFSMDLQKVILLPIMPQSKEAVFVSRLITFNLTFAPINKQSSDPATCVLWHEGEAGREACNIVDALASFLKLERDCLNLHIWADNCTAQNKNWTIFTALVTIVNSGQYNNLQTVTLSYLTKGHTHMTADSVHGNIEKKIKRQGSVYDFTDFKDVVQHSRNKMRIVELTERMAWPKKRRVAKNTETDPLKSFTLNKVVQAKFVCGSRKVLFKTSFEEEFKELDFLIKNYNVSVLPNAITGPRGIKTFKKDGIIDKLVPLMPESRRKFWHEMSVNNASVDLQTGGEVHEEV